MRQDVVKEQLKKEIQVKTSLFFKNSNIDRLCGLVIRVPGYRCTGLDSIPGATRFSEK
jgi:hypothetical protein